MDKRMREVERLALAGDPQAERQLAIMERRINPPMTITINGDEFEITDTRQIGYGDLYEIETEEGETFIISESSQTAGVAARERWQDMAENDPAEFTLMVGETTLIQWGLGRSAGPGSTHVSSLQEWLDLWLTTPKEEWAEYDSEEREVTFCSDDLSEELGFTPGVAYRCD